MHGHSNIKNGDLFVAEDTRGYQICDTLFWVKQLPPHSAHILPPDSPASQQIQQGRKP